MAGISGRGPMWGCAWLLLATLWWAGPAGAAQDAEPAAAGTFLSISDVHFNPFYDPSLVPRLVQADVQEWEGIFAGSQVTAVSTYGSDVNYPLLRSGRPAERGPAAGLHPDLG